MFVLHDGPSGDLAHLQAIAEIEEGFALFDYVRIEQHDGKAWIGQIVQPNQNISTVGNRLDPTILHGLRLMQSHHDVQSIESVQVFDILILGQYDGRFMLTPRLRPLPGALVHKLSVEDTCRVIELPGMDWHDDGSPNVIGELLNAEDVPLCITLEKFNYHVMIAGGTGSGKSNAAANLIDQALKFGKCVLVHDAKPDYGLVTRPNTDTNVDALWGRLCRYDLEPHAAADVVRVGFYGKCEPDAVDAVVGFRASDCLPDMLASLFFVGSNSAEQNAYEGFASAAAMLWRAVEDGQRTGYTMEEILREVRRRGATDSPQVDAAEAIHEATAKSILRKVDMRRRNMPWLDAVSQPATPVSTDRLRGSRLDGQARPRVGAFSLEDLVRPGRLLVIDYAQMDEQSYALLLSYFLRVCQDYRKQRHPVGLVQLVDEAHRVFDNDSRHNGTLASAFERVMREGRSVDHSIILSLQNASQIPGRVMNNLNTKIVMRQNSRMEADVATQTMGKEFATQSMRLGTGHALVSMHESRATVLAQMAPSPFDLMRNDNTSAPNTLATPTRRDDR